MISLAINNNQNLIENINFQSQSEAIKWINNSFLNHVQNFGYDQLNITLKEDDLLILVKNYENLSSYFMPYSV